MTSNVKKIICSGYAGLIKGIYFLYSKNALLGILASTEILTGTLIIGTTDVTAEEFPPYI